MGFPPTSPALSTGSLKLDDAPMRKCYLTSPSSIIRAMLIRRSMRFLKGSYFTPSLLACPATVSTTPEMLTTRFHLVLFACCTGVSHRQFDLQYGPPLSIRPSVVPGGLGPMSLRNWMNPSIPSHSSQIVIPRAPYRRNLGWLLVRQRFLISCHEMTSRDPEDLASETPVNLTSPPFLPPPQQPHENTFP